MFDHLAGALEDSGVADTSELVACKSNREDWVLVCGRPSSLTLANWNMTCKLENVSCPFWEMAGCFWS